MVYYEMRGLLRIKPCVGVLRCRPKVVVVKVVDGGGNGAIADLFMTV